MEISTQYAARCGRGGSKTSARDGMMFGASCLIVVSFVSVPIINNLPKSTILKIVDALEEVRFEHGEYVIRQDQPGDTFYIISKGSVSHL